MKKLNVLIITMFVVALLIGCGSSAAKRPLPAWFDELPPADVVWGIGFANLQDEHFTMQTATSRAHRDAAQQISVLVQGELIDYASQSGLANDPRYMMSIENIGTNLVNMSLSGAAINVRERMPDGTWFVRVAVRKTELTRQVNSIVTNEMADFADFRADQALRRLEYSIENSTTRPVGVGD